MNIASKFQEIINFQKNNSDESFGTLNNPISNDEIEKIERLLEEKLPNEIKELYIFANGQGDGYGVFFGEEFCKADEIIDLLEISRTFINSGTKTLSNPQQSEKLIQQIVDSCVSQIPKRKLFGLQKKSWYKMKFNCGPGSFGGPYLYANENTEENDWENLDINPDEILQTVKELHELEEPTYKWDEINFVVYSNGKYEVERSVYDFDNLISFTSTPKNAIQKKYFHYKWLPIFSDYGGNYIGIDLDPDTEGTKGQVINFGRNEDDMYVLAENLNSFFDKILEELNQSNNRLANSETHPHEILIEMIKK